MNKAINTAIVPEEVIKKFNWLGFEYDSMTIWKAYEIIRYYYPEYDLCVYRSIKDDTKYVTDVENYDTLKMFRDSYGKLYTFETYEEAWIRGLDLILDDLMNNDFVYISRRCPHCGKISKVKIPKDEWENWDNGKGGLIQNCLPSLSQDDRELLLSGICPECWKSIFFNEDEYPEC